MPRYRAGAGTHKYHAVRTVVDGLSFASKAEAKRYGELKLLEKAKQIHALAVQPRYGLYAGTDRRPLVGEYRADFVYCKCLDEVCNGRLIVVEDVKGFKTPLYQWKKKHFEAQYGITITEITR